MATKAEIVSGLKQAKAELEQQLAGINAALAAFGAGTAPAKGAKGKGKAPKRAGGMTPGIQAALDARAVKSGKATPEQQERHAKRLEAKAAATPPPNAPDEGASLAEAAAS